MKSCSLPLAKGEDMKSCSLPLAKGEDMKSCSLPFARGGLGWGNSPDLTHKLRCVYAVAPSGRGEQDF